MCPAPLWIVLSRANEVPQTAGRPPPDPRTQAVPRVRRSHQNLAGDNVEKLAAPVEIPSLKRRDEAEDITRFSGFLDHA
jgi:hypothetical protein